MKTWTEAELDREMDDMTKVEDLFKEELGATSEALSERQNVVSKEEYDRILDENHQLRSYVDRLEAENRRSFMRYLWSLLSGTMM